jgi:hypothetical protein
MYRFCTSKQVMASFAVLKPLMHRLRGVFDQKYKK